jgi:DNA-binding MarR family transcriptional regulator
VGEVTQVLTSSRKPAGADARERAVSGALVDGIDYGPLAEWIGFHLRMAQIASFQAFAREVGEVDLPPGRFALLTLIGRNPGISQTVLSRAAGKDKSTLTPALRDLKRRGLIDRQRLARDRRSYHLTLTPAGKAMLERLTECASRHDRNLDRIVGPRDKPKLLRFLRKIMSELD